MDTPRYINRKAYFDYSVEETVEAGIELQGSEVKAIRTGRIDMAGAYAQISEGECWLHGVKLTYAMARDHIDPVRTRKLLLSRQEINRLSGMSDKKGYTLIPLEVYFKGSWAKVKIGLCTGKKAHDKREALKEKAIKMDAKRGD